MTFQKTFYFSQILDKKIHDSQGIYIGRIKDLVVELPTNYGDEAVTLKPRVIGVKIKVSKQIRFISFSDSNIEISKFKGFYKVKCTTPVDIPDEFVNNGLLLKENILDKQIVDINGKKVVRVNDIRLVLLSSGAFVIAVDVGIDGLLRRIDINKPIQFFLSLFRINIPAKFILWDDVETVDFTKHNIKLSKASSKLHTLHPSDLADIIEDLGKTSKTNVFSSLDEEKAADVLEELEKDSQIHIIESLPIDKAADVLEKMPANEAADIIEELEDEKAELLLNEMEHESSEEVRELLEYHNNMVGSIMTTDFLSFTQDITVGEAFKIIRDQKPENDLLYNLFITDNNEKLIATLSLRDLIISDLETPLKKIMKNNPISVIDDERIDSLAEITSKYNLLAIPVTDKENILRGMVVIDDIVEDLVNKGRTNK